MTYVQNSSLKRRVEARTKNKVDDKNEAITKTRNNLLYFVFIEKSH